MPQFFSSLFNFSDLEGLLTTARVLTGVRIVFIISLAFVLVPWVRRGLEQIMRGHWSAAQLALLRRAVTYFIWGLALTTTLKELGFELSWLFGFLGFGGAAVAFGSQTLMSNFLSGVFLTTEQPFGPGDTITINNVTGEVLSIDLMSIKLRTPDNLYVRIPNSSAQSSLVTNVSHFPIRRLDIEVTAAYRHDINVVREVLMGAAERNPLGLEDPRPIFMFQAFADSAMKITFSVWGRRENYIDLKNSMFAGIKEAFDRRGLEMPFPQRVISVSSAGEPLALKFDEKAASSARQYVDKPNESLPPKGSSDIFADSPTTREAMKAEKNVGVSTP